VAICGLAILRRRAGQPDELPDDGELSLRIAPLHVRLPFEKRQVGVPLLVEVEIALVAEFLEGDPVPVTEIDRVMGAKQCHGNVSRCRENGVHTM
jgi:hypothetical protein